LTIQPHVAPRLKKGYCYTSAPSPVSSWHDEGRSVPLFYFFLISNLFLSSCLFLSGSQQSYTPHHSQCSLFDHVNTVRKRYKLWSFSLPNFMQFKIPSSQLGPNIFLSILLSKNLSVFQSLNCRGWCSPSRWHLQSQPKYQ
jgi:hypothetical protein